MNSTLIKKMLLLIFAVGQIDFAFAQKRLKIDETTIQSMSNMKVISGIRTGKFSDKKRIVELDHDFSHSAQAKAKNHFKWK